MTSIPQQSDIPLSTGISGSQAGVQKQSPSALQGPISTAPAVGRSHLPNAFQSSNMATAIKGSMPSQHGNGEAIPPVNGNIPIIAPLPSVGVSAGINGNNIVPASTIPDHNRKPSFTFTPSGGLGGPPAGQPNKANNIQFGSVNAVGSPASPALVPANLGIPGLVDPRTQSPSPVRQPFASGGKPPSLQPSLQPLGLVFGQSGPNRQMPEIAADTFPLGGPHASNLRRESSQSSQLSQGDTGNNAIPGGSGHRYPIPAGRSGRAAFQPPQYSPFPPQQNYRGQPNQRATPPFQGRPYPNSPGIGGRSPALMNANPAVAPMPPMLVPGMPGQPYGFQGHHGYPQVNRHVSSFNPPSNRGKAGKRKGASNFNNLKRDSDHLAAPRNDPKSRLPDLALMAPPPEFSVDLDLSPASGNFERILTAKQQVQRVELQVDPSLEMYRQQWLQGTQMQGYPQAASPSQGYSQGPNPQFIQQQYNHGRHPPQAQSMSRTSSKVSTSEHPTSSLGQPPTTPMPPVTGLVTSTHGSQGEFIIPPKKKAALVIKNQDGVVQPVVKTSSTTPARATPSPVKAGTPPVPTTRSRSVSTVDASRARADSVNDKSGEEKRKAMQDAVAKKIAEDAKVKQDMEDVEKKALEQQDGVEMREKEALQQKEMVDTSSEEVAAPDVEVQNADKSDSEVPKVVEPSTAENHVEEQLPVVDQGGPEEEDEFEKLARQMEAEEAAREEEEKEKEKAYQAKKQADLEAQKQREAIEEAAYYTNMKQAEREAEEAEEARQRKRTEAAEGEEKKAVEDVVMAEESSTPPFLRSPIVRTPVESGAATPVSDVSMGPPARNAAASRRERPMALALDTAKTVEPPQPSAAMRALRSARFLENPASINYPDTIASPNPALNKNAPADRRFKYNKEFLLQFQNVFKEKPSLDWDAKIRDTIGDGNDSSTRPNPTRTLSTMGTRSTSNQPSVMQSFTGMGGSGMGNFKPPPRAGATNLSSGTTPAERLALSNQIGGPRGTPMPNNPFNLGRPPGVPMSRNSSSNTPPGQTSYSPRLGSQRGNPKVGSKRDKTSTKKGEEENKNMPLTASMPVKPIETSSTAWKPRSLGQAAGADAAPDGHMAPDEVQRKVKAALNKMTPSNLKPITGQILEIAAQSKNETDGRTLRQVIQLTFEKAIDEAHWAKTYAEFCASTLEFMNSDIKDENIKDKHGNVVAGGALFRKYLLNRCQEEFERGWKAPEPEGKTREAVILSDEYYIAEAAKRRGLGLVKFIGELYKLNMLTERIIHECIKKLLELDEGRAGESEVETLVNLLKTVGENLEKSEHGPAMLNAYFKRIASIMEHPDLPSRLRFLLLDVIDLRVKKGWKQDHKPTPQTIAEVHADDQRKKQEEELKRLQQASIPRSGGGGRLPMGRGDARNFSNGPPTDNLNSVNKDDLQRLGRFSRNASRNSSRNPNNLDGPAFVPSSLLSNSRRGQGSFLARGEDSSRTGTPTPREKDKKDDGVRSSTNAFSPLAALEGESAPSAASSPPTTKLHPTREQQPSESPEKGNE